MAIFNRRDIQAALDQIAPSLTRQQLVHLVKRLNGNPSQTISAEWEAIIISALSKCGHISHELSHGGSTRPDILFRDENSSLEFLTEIRALSDKNIHEENPYHDFFEAIKQYLKKLGHNSSGLYINVGHNEEGEYKNRKLKLALPKKSEIEVFVATKLGEFLSGIVQDPLKSSVFRYDTKEIRFSISYSGNEKKFNGGSYVSYTVPYSIRNPLLNALIEKGNQLVKSRYKGIKGIIVCDGGCDSLNERSEFNGAYSCQKIVESYLKSHSYISWVLVLRIDEEAGLFLTQAKIKISARMYWNSPIDSRAYEETLDLINRMLNCTAIPRDTPKNAINWLKNNKNIGRSLYGGYSMSGNKIKISTRALTELLAGQIGLQQFLEDHRLKPNPLDPGDSSISFFENQINRGNMMKNASVERTNDNDDDWLVLEYSGPDPAISPFQTPK